MSRNDIHSAGEALGNTAIELQDAQISQSEREQVSLPPADGGYQAWLVLAGCFVINVLIWGACNSMLSLEGEH